MIKRSKLFDTAEEYLEEGIMNFEDVKTELNIHRLNEELLEAVSRIIFEMKYYYNEDFGLAIERINEMIDFLTDLKEEVEVWIEDNEKKEQKN